MSARSIGLVGGAHYEELDHYNLLTFTLATQINICESGLDAQAAFTKIAALLSAV